LPREHFDLYRRDFTEVALSSNLVNLARMVKSLPLPETRRNGKLAPKSSKATMT
jgi:hypothetical protein